MRKKKSEIIFNNKVFKQIIQLFPLYNIVTMYREIYCDIKLVMKASWWLSGKTLPATVGDMGLMSDLGRSYMPRDN